MFALVLVAALSQPCGGDLNQADLDQCWLKQAEVAQRDLDGAYAKLKTEPTGLGIKTAPLATAQSAWNDAREKTCDFEQSLEEGGSIAPMMYSECEARMAQARTARMKTLQTALQNGGSAPKALPLSPKAGEELDRVYGLLFKYDLSAASHAKLVAAEAAWKTYRCRACAAEGGSCLTDLTVERTNELKDGWLGEPFW
jgi:uncharacterized protein YecT (DUF1311 family)